MLYFVLPLAQLYGHSHKDKIHLLYPQDGYPLTYPQQNKTALLIAPSISPIHGNNPAFRLFAFNLKKKKPLQLHAILHGSISV